MEAEPVVFRDARREDIAAILALTDAGTATGFERPASDPAHPDVLAAFELIAASPDHRLIVCEREGEIVGTLQASRLPGLMRNGMWRGILESVHVRADCRGQGIGGEMVRYGIGLCRDMGCGMVQLTSNKVRTDAHRFYERLGFERSHEGFKLML